MSWFKLLIDIIKAFKKCEGDDLVIVDRDKIVYISNEWNTGEIIGYYAEEYKKYGEIDNLGDENSDDGALPF